MLSIGEDDAFGPQRYFALSQAQIEGGGDRIPAFTPRREEGRNVEMRQNDHGMFASITNRRAARTTFTTSPWRPHRRRSSAR